MPISPDRPDCFRLPAVDAAAIRTRPHQLHLVPPGSGTDAPAIIESHRRVRVARGRRDAIGCLIPIAGGLFLSAVIGATSTSLRIPFPHTAAAGALLFVPGAMMIAVITARVSPATPVPKPLPSVLVHPLVAAGAPADLPASDLVLASRVLDERDRATPDLRKARADARLSDEERQVSPGDRTTWYFRPEDLPQLERTAADADARSRVVTGELGIVLGAHLGTDSTPGG